MKNAPSELELLRRVASAAEWAIQSNGDDPVGRDGRSRVGINSVMAQGQLATALLELKEFHSIQNHYAIEREKAAALGNMLRAKPRRASGRGRA